MPGLTWKLQSTAANNLAGNIKESCCFPNHKEKEWTCAAISESFVMEMRYPMLHVGKINLQPL